METLSEREREREREVPVNMGRLTDRKTGRQTDRQPEGQMLLKMTIQHFNIQSDRHIIINQKPPHCSRIKCLE